jgi:hypothetical protein
MRYVTNADDYLVAVSFGADVECQWGICTQYEGEVPDKYSSLDAWYLAECEQLWKWKIVDGSLVYDADAVLPEEEPEEDFTDSVVERGISGVWRYRKWRSGYCELWTKTNVLPPPSTQEGSNYYSDICTLDLPFHVSDGVVTGSAHFLHWVTNAEVWEDGWTVGFRLMRSTEVYTDVEVPVQLNVQGSYDVDEPDIPDEPGSDLTVTDDGAGTATIEAYGSAASITDDGAGNVRIWAPGAIKNDGAGNVTIL